MSATVGVGHSDRGPEEPLPDVRRIDGASCQRDDPELVTDRFQVSARSVEPRTRRACNLFASQSDGSARSDEAKEIGPQIPIVGEAALLAGGAEGLAGNGSGPKRSVVGPAGEAGGDAPETGAGEAVKLDASQEIEVMDFPDRFFDDGSWRDQPGRRQMPQHRARDRIDLVVDRAHISPSASR
jgi:hypothetical protein